MADYRWDAAAGRYRDAGGRYVADGVVRAAVDALLDDGTLRLQALSARLATGTLALAEWQQAMAVELKRIHLVVGTAAHGGWAHMAPADYGWIGQRLRTQYAYLQAFAAQVASGAQPLDGRVAARAELYAQAGRATFEELRRRDMRLRGVTEARRVLHAAEHCAGCVGAAAQGWQPLDEVPPIGAFECRSRCRCTLQYRTRAEEAA